MTVTAESLIELIDEAQKAYDDVQKELDDLAARAVELNKQREDLAIERAAFVSSLARRFPGSLAPAINQAPDGKPFGSRIPDNDWSLISRSDAVERVVEELTDEKGFATPAEIEAHLKRMNRTDTRDAIGAALAYLNRTDKVHSLTRAQWIHGAQG